MNHSVIRHCRAAATSFVIAAAAALAAAAEPDAAPPDDGREEVEAALVAAFDGEPPALMLRYAGILERAGEAASARSWARRVLGAREGLSETDRAEADALAERLGLGPGDAAPPPAVRWRDLEGSAAWCANVRTNAALPSLGSQKAEIVALLRRELFAPLLAETESAPAWGEEARAFVRDELDLVEREIFAHGNWSMILGREASWARASALLERGATDPFLRWMRAMDLFAKGREADAFAALDAVLGDIAGDPSRAFLRFLALHTRAWKRGWPGGDYLEMRDACVAWAETLADRPEATWGVYFFVRQLVGATVRDRQTAFARSKADPWIARMIEGEVELDLAWKARGSGWASEVTEEGWKGFAEHRALARKAFAAAWLMAPERPGPATGMLTALAGERSVAESDAWFRRATEAECDDPDAFDRYFWYACAPRWGGSPARMLRMAEVCRDAAGDGNCIGLYYPEFLARYAEDSGVDPRKVFGDPAYGPAALRALRKGIEGGRPDTRMLRDRARNLRPMVAWWAGDIAGAVAACKDRGDEPFRGEWCSNPYAVFDRLEKLGGPHGERLSPLERLRRAEDWAALAEAAEKAVAEAEAQSWDEDERRFAATARGTARFALAAAAGDWLPLTGGDATTAWHVHAGAWSPDPDVPDAGVRWTVGDADPLAKSTIHPNLDFPGGGLRCEARFAFDGVGTGAVHAATIELKDVAPRGRNWPGALLVWRDGRLGAVAGEIAKLMKDADALPEPSRWIEADGGAAVTVEAVWSDAALEIRAGPSRALLASFPTDYCDKRQWLGPGLLILRGRNVTVSGLRVAPPPDAR